jgi:hypothetical protein
MTMPWNSAQQDIAARLEAWRNEVYAYLKDIGKAVHETLEETRQRPTRQEVESMLATKINADVYNAEMKSIRDDINEIREKPQKLNAWFGTVIAGAGCLVTVISVVLSVAIAVGTLMLQHWHP